MSEITKIPDKKFPIERVVKLMHVHMPDPMAESLVKSTGIPKPDHLKIAETFEELGKHDPEKFHCAARIYVLEKEPGRAAAVLKLWEKNIQERESSEWTNANRHGYFFEDFNDYYHTHQRWTLKARTEIAKLWMELGELDNAVVHAMAIAGKGNNGVTIEQLDVAFEIFQRTNYLVNAARALTKRFETTPERFERAIELLCNAGFMHEALEICAKFWNDDEYYEVIAKAYVKLGVPDKAFEYYLWAGNIEAATLLEKTERI